jgi:hypothetical protein
MPFQPSKRGAEGRVLRPFSPSQVSPHPEGEDQQSDNEIAAGLGRVRISVQIGRPILHHVPVQPSCEIESRFLALWSIMVMYLNRTSLTSRAS